KRLSNHFWLYLRQLGLDWRATPSLQRLDAQAQVLERARQLAPPYFPHMKPSAQPHSGRTHAQLCCLIGSSGQGEGQGKGRAKARQRPGKGPGKETCLTGQRPGGLPARADVCRQSAAEGAGIKCGARTNLPARAGEGLGREG